jgi:hypothetical protein
MGMKGVLQAIVGGKRAYSTPLKPVVCYLTFHAICKISAIRLGLKLILLAIQPSNFAQKPSLCNKVLYALLK